MRRRIVETIGMRVGIIKGGRAWHNHQRKLQRLQQGKQGRK
jgi:hypothetical protein